MGATGESGCLTKGTHRAGSFTTTAIFTTTQPDIFRLFSFRHISLSSQVCFNFSFLHFISFQKGISVYNVSSSSYSYVEGLFLSCQDSLPVHLITKHLFSSLFPEMLVHEEVVTFLCHILQWLFDFENGKFYNSPSNTNAEEQSIL